MYGAERKSPSGTLLRYVTSLTATLALLVVCDNAGLAQQDPSVGPRAAMVSRIRSYSDLLPELARIDHISSAVLDVMNEVPRHRFVPDDVKNQAYADMPLPIGYGQTISQPFIVALMTELVRTTPDSTMLEIGTGSGYQAAVLSRLVKSVCTIEIIPALGEAATRRLADLGYDNIRAKIGDGYFGWPECGPFDGILVTAATGHVPPSLVEQLKPGGRIVVPVGGPFEPQFLTLVEKAADGKITTHQILPVSFVPLTRAPQ